MEASGKHQQKILVTGATGLLGQNLLQQLCASHTNIVALTHTGIPVLQHPSITYVQGNILDVSFLEEVMSGVQQLYHCAAIVSFDPRQARQLFKINVEGTANIVNAALDANVQKLVHVSSVAALQALLPGVAITENMFAQNQKPEGRYAQSKYLGEMEVWRGIAEGLHAAIVNPSVILGVGNWNEGSTKLFQNAYHEFPFYTRGGAGFVGVHDVARAMIFLMKSNVEGERFILNSENRTFKDVFTQMADCFSKRPPRFAVTPFMAGLVWRIQKLKSALTGQSPLITKETARSAQRVRSYNNEKFLNFFPDFHYQPVSDVIAEVCGALQQKLNKA